MGLVNISIIVVIFFAYYGVCSELICLQSNAIDKVVVSDDCMCHCRRIPAKGVVFELHALRNLAQSGYTSVRISRLTEWLPEPIWATRSSPLMAYQWNQDVLNLFPLSWGVYGGHMHIFTPDVMSDVLGSVCIDLLVADEALAVVSPFTRRRFNCRTREQEQVLDKYARSLTEKIRNAYHDLKPDYPYPVLISPVARTLHGISSDGTLRGYGRVVRRNDEVIWYESDGKTFIARHPMATHRSKRWIPCEKADHYLWAEYEVPISDTWQPNIRMVCSDKVDALGGFLPVGAARVAGRRVLSDFAEARFPKDADWLIWEKSPESSRLCKMAKGKWATCPEMPVQKPPQLIVTDDDNGVVHLVYSFGIDPSDVEGSLRKVAKMLEECGCPLKPQPAKTANAPTAGSSGSHETKKQNVAPPSTNAIPVVSAQVHKGTNQVSAARTPARESEIVRQGTNQVARAKDSEEAAAKAFAEYGIKPEEKAKRGAMLYEKPETREEGLRLLRESAREGSAFALARLSALYYTGDGGVKRDYAMAVKLMEAASAKGFPSFLLPLEKARKALKRAADLKKKGKPGQWPGMGYPGVLLPYGANGTLQKMLDRYSLTAGVFRRDPIGDAMLAGPDARRYLLTEEVPYLLFTPKSGSAPVPLVMYFGGTGEQGKDLAAHFRQRTIFEMVCSPEFQKKRPCYLFAPMVPKDSSMFCSRRYSPPMADLVCDAMYAVIRSAKSPSIDTNRLYLTGLSWGGSVAYTMPLGYAGRFAASVPVAGYTTADCVPDHRPGNFWLLFNEHEYADKGDRARLDEMIRTVTSRGGEFRVSSFPDKGHNSWDKAWREEKVWDWMFSKTADGRSVKTPAVAGGAGSVPKALRGAKCTASKPGRDARTGPERAVDGLDATCYVSKTPFKSGDWWQMEFAEPVSGRVIVKSGYANGRGRVKSAHVETSTNGRTWARCGGFSRASGECHFPLSSPIRYLRVVSKSSSGETMVIREVEIAE